MLDPSQKIIENPPLLLLVWKLPVSLKVFCNTKVKINIF